MGALAKITPRDLTGPQLSLIQRTVAKDCNQVEFDHFMAVASDLALNPLRKQICAIVFNKKDEKKRNMSIIVQIDGFRVIAARSGNYRPMDDEPEVVTHENLKSDTNPLGIERAKVRVWQRHGNEWFPVFGSAKWAEFAPIEREWIECDDGKRRPQGGDKLAANWQRMPEHMIAKCAEAQALRRGWPEQLSGVYAEEEMQRAIVIDAASEMVAEYEETERMKRVGHNGQSLTFLFDPSQPLEVIPRGQVADRLFAFYRETEDAKAIADFRTRNKDALQTFWAWEPADALEAKKFAEQRLEVLAEAAA